MKKVLFATTALVATASVAAADVTIGGYGRFGMLHVGEAGPDAANTDISSRFQLNITGSAVTDSGVTIGGKLTVEQNNGDTNAFNAAQFFVTSGGLTARVGNINGAFDSAPGVYGGSVGFTGLGWGNVVTGFVTHDFQAFGAGHAGSREAVEVVYSMGDVTVHGSHNGTDTEVVVSGSMNGITAAIGASNTDVGIQSKLLATVGGSFGGVNVGIAYANAENDTTHTSLSMSTSIGAATTLSGYVANDEGNVEEMSYGIGVAHNLGGGVTLKGGASSIDDRTRADLGVVFNF